MPADNLLPVATEMIAKPAAAKMMNEPMNSRRTANHLFALIEGNKPVDWRQRAIRFLKQIDVADDRHELS